MARRPRLDRELERYLVGGETVIVAVRRHWFHLIREISMAVGATVLAFWVDLQVPRTPAGEVLLNLTLAIWWAALGWLLWRFLNWRHDWFVATDKRFLLFYGFIRRKVAMMPLMRVTDMTFDRSVLGRLIGYGMFVLESAGQKQALSVIDHVPDADRHYRAICTQLFGPGSQVRMHPAGFAPLPPDDDDGTGGDGGGGPEGPPPVAGPSTGWRRSHSLRGPHCRTGARAAVLVPELEPARREPPRRHRRDPRGPGTPRGRRGRPVVPSASLGALTAAPRGTLPSPRPRSVEVKQDPLPVASHLHPLDPSPGRGETRPPPGRISPRPDEALCHLHRHPQGAGVGGVVHRWTSGVDRGRRGAAGSPHDDISRPTSTPAPDLGAPEASPRHRGRPR